MPELPDVEGFRRYLARYVAGRRIEGISVLDEGVLRNTSAQGLGRALKRRRCGKPDRSGKWLFLPVGSSTLLLHFGMTGGLKWTGAPPESEPADRLVFHFSGGELRYRAQRKLGGIWLARNRKEADKIAGPLGPDAGEVSREVFGKRLRGRRRQIKPALMDQELIAGLGNELSDEILWRARVHPSQRASELDDDTIDAIYDVMRSVLRESVRHGGIPRQVGWLTGVRGTAEPGCPRCGRSIRRSTVGGRTAYWCPRCQKKASR